MLVFLFIIIFCLILIRNHDFYNNIYIVQFIYVYDEGGVAVVLFEKTSPWGMN